MKILVCGGRDYDDWDTLDRVLTTWYEAQGVEVTLIHGGARGADQMAGNWALVNSVPTEVYYPAWDEYGRAAGIIRNTEMLEQGKPDLVFAFPGGRGTAHMVKIAKQAGIEVIEING
jgi:ABC-type Fe3+-hydroxamate transport system substrate-binding protein